MSLASKRCFNHPDREVAILCPECGRFYCRECTSEYQDRFLCKICLDALLTGPVKVRSSFFSRLKPVLGLISGFLLTLFIFYVFAQVLYTMPSYFHSGLIPYEEESK